MAKHMTLDTRKGIAHGLECRLTFAQLATMHGRAVSTIANEVKNRMRWSNRNYGCSNAVCEHFETCSKIYRNADGRRIPFKSQRMCFEMCEDFRQRTCADLVQACSRRRRRSARELAVTKTDAKCRVNRTYEDYLAFLALNFGVQTVELDTVIGSVGGRVLFTMQFTCGLMLAFIRDARTSQTCTRIFNMLQNVAGLEFFRTLFPVVLTDNGSEFSDPRMIEFYRPDPEHNPTKLERRTWVFFCDPYNSQQKPHVERNHEEIRRVLTKGASFDALVQDDVNLMLSHVNSSPRPSLGGRSPYDEFVAYHGERGRAFLEKLGIRKINAENIVLDPILLGPKFKQEANRAILRRNGVAL